MLKAKGGNFGDVMTKVLSKFDAGGNEIAWSNMNTEYANVYISILKGDALKHLGTALDIMDPVLDAPFVKQALDNSNNPGSTHVFYEKVDSHVVVEWIKSVLH